MIIEKKLSTILKHNIGFKAGDRLSLRKRKLCLGLKNYREVNYQTFIFGTIYNIDIDLWNMENCYGIGGDYVISFYFDEEMSNPYPNQPSFKYTGRRFMFSVPISCFESHIMEGRPFVTIIDFGDVKHLGFDFSPDLYERCEMHMEGLPLYNFFKPQKLPEGRASLLRSKNSMNSIDLLRLNNKPNYMIPTSD